MTSNTASMWTASDTGRRQPSRLSFEAQPLLAAGAAAALARHFGIAVPLAVENAAAALNLALDLAGVNAGDEVIVPAQTSLASGMAILMRRATPVFADIDPRDGNITPATLLEKITPRTTAVIPAHWGGYPCDLMAIQRTALMYGLAVIEDGGPALGAACCGVPIGASSRFTCLTVPAIEQSATSPVALLCCRHTRDWWAARQRLQRSPADEESRPERFDPEEATESVGHPAAWSDIPRLRQQIARRQALGGLYRAGLADVPGLELPPLADDRMHAFAWFTVLVQGRNDFVRKLQSQHIAAAVGHRSIKRFTTFNGNRQDLPGQAQFNAAEATLPLHPHLTPTDVERVVATIRTGW